MKTALIFVSILWKSDLEVAQIKSNLDSYQLTKYSNPPTN